jgi:hypothetical protein
LRLIMRRHGGCGSCEGPSAETHQAARPFDRDGLRLIRDMYGRAKRMPLSHRADLGLNLLFRRLAGGAG